MTPNSIMPRYTWLLEDEVNFEEIQGRVDAMAMLGVPYGEALLEGAAPAMAREQAASNRREPRSSRRPARGADAEHGRRSR